MMFAIPSPDLRASSEEKLRCGLEFKLWERDDADVELSHPNQSRLTSCQDYPTALAANFFLVRRIFYLHAHIAIATARLRSHTRSYQHYRQVRFFHPRYKIDVEVRRWSSDLKRWCLRAQANAETGCISCSPSTQTASASTRSRKWCLAKLRRARIPRGSALTIGIRGTILPLHRPPLARPGRARNRRISGLGQGDSWNLERS